MKRTKDILGQKVCQAILFIHSILGCNSTSRVHGIGKAASLKMATKNAHFCHLAEAFCGDPPRRVASKLENVCLSVSTMGQTRKFSTLYVLQTILRESPEEFDSCWGKMPTLPPTSAVARYDNSNLRVFFQISDWKGDISGLQSTEWGWKEGEGWLLPKMTDRPPAPSKLIEMFRCDFKTGCIVMFGCLLWIVAKNGWW